MRARSSPARTSSRRSRRAASRPPIVGGIVTASRSRTSVLELFGPPFAGRPRRRASPRDPLEEERIPVRCLEDPLGASGDSSSPVGKRRQQLGRSARSSMASRRISRWSGRSARDPPRTSSSSGRAMNTKSTGASTRRSATCSTRSRERWLGPLDVVENDDQGRRESSLPRTGGGPPRSSSGPARAHRPRRRPQRSVAR